MKSEEAKTIKELLIAAKNAKKRMLSLDEIMVVIETLADDASPSDDEDVVNTDNKLNKSDIVQNVKSYLEKIQVAESVLPPPSNKAIQCPRCKFIFEKVESHYYQTCPHCFLQLQPKGDGSEVRWY